MTCPCSLCQGGTQKSQKRPAWHFYVGDWRKDTGVQSLSYHDRGVWFELLCLMHESEQRGELRINGRAIEESELARLLGIDKKTLKASLTTVRAAGVSSLCPRDGALLSRRMIRDEQGRVAASKCGKLGGNPALVPRTLKGSLNQSGYAPPEDEDEKPFRVSGGSAEGGPTLAEVQASAATLGLPAEEAEKFYNHYASQGWKKPNGLPISDALKMLPKWKARWQEIQSEKGKNHGNNSTASRPNSRNAVMGEAGTDYGALYRRKAIGGNPKTET